MSVPVEYIAGQTWHGRRGGIANEFVYGVDYVLLDPEADVSGPALFSRNGGNVMALCDSDHGGAPGRGRGAPWLREVLDAHGLGGVVDGHVLLLAQPRTLGHVFNPVSFWLCHDRDGFLRAVVAEVTNTYGDRHSYLCHRDDMGVIVGDERISARKVFHVSPFQPVEGDYTFRFGVDARRIEIVIDYRHAGGGLVATLSGARRPLTNAVILRALLRRPFGSRRVLGLIHWQAFKLWLKGATFRRRPEPPADEVSR